MNEQMILMIVVTAVLFLLLLIISVILRPLVFLFEPIFSSINYFIWLVSNPFRGWMKNSDGRGARSFFILVSLTGLTVAWFVVVYILTFPLRLVTALYYDVLLFLSVSISDNIQEFLNPKRGGFRHKRGIGYLWHYLISLPFRFITFCVKSGIYLLDSFMMLGVSIVMPTLTMKHGTSFQEAGTKITQSGNWYVGQGNFAGTGIYFGMFNKIANYYAPNGHDASIILARVTLTFSKTIASLRKAERDKVGLGQSGEELAQSVKSFFFASTEHWRVDMKWWEYCLLKPQQMGEFVNTWRVRPVALIRSKKIVRTWGGFYHYSMGSGFWAGLICWLIIFRVVLMLTT